MKFPKIFGNKANQNVSYICHCCGKEFEGSPSVASKYPVQFYDIPHRERDTRVLMQTSDLSHLLLDDGEFYFIRCTLEVPIDGHGEGFLWGVWVSQSKESFDLYKSTFDDDQTGLGSFGWLTVADKYYLRDNDGSGLENLPCNVHFGKDRPEIEIKACDHPWYADHKTAFLGKKLWKYFSHIIQNTSLPKLSIIKYAPTMNMAVLIIG